MRVDPLLKHRRKVIIRDLTGAGADGDTLAAPRTLDRALIDDTRKLVRDRNGVQVVASSSVYTRPEDTAAPGSQVTIWAGTPQERTTTVIASERLDFSHVTPNHAVLHLE